MNLKLRLDDGCQYDPVAMFRPVRVSRPEAWRAFRANLGGWRKGLLIPWTAPRITLAGTANWLIVMLANTLSLVLLPVLAVFGLSMKAYQVFRADDQARLLQYRQDLKAVYERLKSVDDPDEYRRRLEEEIARIKPFP